MLIARMGNCHVGPLAQLPNRQRRHTHVVRFEVVVTPEVDLLPALLLKFAPKRLVPCWLGRGNSVADQPFTAAHRCDLEILRIGYGKLCHWRIRREPSPAAT